MIDYVDGAGTLSARPVRPLVLEFWGRVWTLAAWCETREGFRSFRIDRIRQLLLTGEAVPEEPGRSLVDWRDLHDSRVAGDG